MARQNHHGWLAVMLAFTSPSGAVEPSLESPPPRVASDDRIAAAAAPSRAVIDAAREASRDAPPAPVGASDERPPAPPSAADAMRKVRKSCGALQTIGLAAAVVVACGRLNACPSGIAPRPTEPACKIDRWL